MAITVREALAQIPSRRDALDAADNQLSRAIRHVQHALCELRVCVPVDVSMPTEDGEQWLRFDKRSGQWAIRWGKDDNPDNDQALLSAPRLVRAEAFSVARSETGLAPIEALVVSAAETLGAVREERTHALEVAERLRSALEAAGFREPAASEAP